MMNQAMGVLATGGATLNVQEVMTTAVTSAQGEMMGILVIVIPVVAAVSVAIVSSKFGLKWIRSLGKG